MNGTNMLVGALAASICGLIVVGCDEGADPDPPSRFVTVDELAGTWLRDNDWGTERVEFGTNMTFVWTVTDELGTDTWDGTFELTDEGVLVSTAVGSSFEGGVSESWSTVTRETPVVIGDRYYPVALIRRDGDGETLDGTWAYVESERTEVELDDGGDVTTDVDEFQITMDVVITGDQASVRIEETQTVDGENYFSIERYVGTLRMEGDQILITYTEEDSSPIPEEEQIEEHFGWRLDDDSIDLLATEDDDPADLAFVRQ